MFVFFRPSTFGPCIYSLSRVKRVDYIEYRLLIGLTHIWCGLMLLDPFSKTGIWVELNLVYIHFQADLF